MIPKIMTDPHDSTCSRTWDDLTTKEQVIALKEFREIVKRTNVHWVIKISLAGHSVPNEGRWGETWPHVIYPLKFSSYDDACAYGFMSPDPALRPSGFKSWSVESVRENKDHIPHPRVRKPDFIPNPEPRKRKRR